MSSSRPGSRPLRRRGARPWRASLGVSAGPRREPASSPDGLQSFYRGELAEDRRAPRAQNGAAGCARRTLAAFRPEWVEPLSVEPGGCTVPRAAAERPRAGGAFWRWASPLGLGWVQTLRGGLLFADRGDEARLCGRAALTWRSRAAWSSPRPSCWTGPNEAARAGLICQTALEPEPGDPARAARCILCAADGEGNMVSWLQSNVMGFSGVAVTVDGRSPTTGVATSLDPASPNCMAPGKRPYHTIIPGFLRRRGSPWPLFWRDGGFHAAAGHVQVVSNTLDFLVNPQEALDAPRWQWTGGRRIELEPAFPSDFAAGCAAAGMR